MSRSKAGPGLSGLCNDNTMCIRAPNFTQRDGLVIFEWSAFPRENPREMPSRETTFSTRRGVRVCRRYQIRGCHRACHVTPPSFAQPYQRKGASFVTQFQNDFICMQIGFSAFERFNKRKKKKKPKIREKRKDGGLSGNSFRRAKGRGVSTFPNALFRANIN